MASLEVHGVIGPTTLPLLCAEQTMANHCKTQFARIGPILSILLSPLTFLCRSWSLGLGTSGNLGNRVKKWLFRRYCRWKKPGKPCYHEIRLIWSNLQYNHPKWPNVEGFFHQQYAAISRIHVYPFHVFLVVLDLRRVSERLCEFCLQCKKLSGSKMFS